MNDTISTLIAFVGFLIVFSMLAQSVQEALKSAFKLKSGVWERFLLSLYQREFQIGGAGKISSTPFLQRVVSGEFVGDFDSRLKRLKEIVVSADDLLQTVKRTLHDIATISPANPYSPNLLQPKAQELTKKVKELTGLKLDALLSIYDRLDANAITGLTNALRSFENTYPDLGFSVKQVDAKMLAALQKDCDQLLTAIIAAEKKVSDYRQQIECKIDSWITQVNEEYRRNMLKWTVVTGFLLVLMFNADAFLIYKYLSTSPKMQAAVVSSAQDAATKVLTSKSEDLNAIDALIREEKMEQASKAAILFSQRLENDFTMFKDKENAKKATDVRADIAKIKPGENGTGARVLQGREGELMALFTLLHKTAVDYHIQGLATLDLPLGWTEAWNRSGSSLGNDKKFVCFVSKVVGLLLTTFLITFGAPFWNDILTALVGFKNSMKMKSGTS